MESQNENTDNKKEELQDNSSKQVGYGSSIQTDGYGNRNRPQPHDDVNPTSQQDHIQELKKAGEKTDERIPQTEGTGSNHAVPTDESLILKKKDKD